MSDVVDRSNSVGEIVHQSLINSRKDVPNISYVGYCHYCGEDVEEPKLYCSGDCATAHDKELSRK